MEEYKLFTIVQHIRRAGEEDKVLRMTFTNLEIEGALSALIADPDVESFTVFPRTTF